MVARILVYEPTISRNVDEQYPTGSARQAVCHGNELIAPTVHRSEIGDKRPGELLGRSAVAECQAREVKLVEQRGIEGDKLLAFKAIHDVGWSIGEIERLEVLDDRVQAP